MAAIIHLGNMEYVESGGHAQCKDAKAIKTIAKVRRQADRQIS